MIKNLDAHQKKFKKVRHEWKEGDLHSGSKKGPKVKSQKQAEAIAFSESRKDFRGKMPKSMRKK
ncbi:MAG TPA: DUF6496 domain-containing protein [Flavitalea sp.]|jgi:hypothetical protein|nr:DUF6496 domain-containing protein [Flavitalea sp.]